MKALTSIAAAVAFAVPLAISTPANAAAEYCHRDYDGDYVCIHAVYGPRNNRGITASHNGVIDNIRVDCYNRTYGSTSLIAYACWSYTGISKESPEFPADTTKDLSEAFSSKGFVSSENAIDIDKAIESMPPEMK